VLTTLIGSRELECAEDRGDRGITFLDAANRHKCTCCWGDLRAILAMAPRYIWWMMPILSGLICPLPLTMLTTRASVGRGSARADVAHA